MDETEALVHASRTGAGEVFAAFALLALLGSAGCVAPEPGPAREPEVEREEQARDETPSPVVAAPAAPGVAPSPPAPTPAPSATTPPVSTPAPAPSSSAPSSPSPPPSDELEVFYLASSNNCQGNNGGCAAVECLCPGVRVLVTLCEYGSCASPKRACDYASQVGGVACAPR